MANVLIGWNEHTKASALYTPSFSGGSWETDLPLGNVVDRRLHLPARSTDDAVASTVFTVDLGVDRSIRLAALLSNISAAGTVRVRGFTSVPVLDALDFSTGWSSTGTPTRVAASYDGSGADGVPLDLIGDDDGAAVEGYRRTVAFTGDGVKALAFRVKVGTATSTRVRIRDNTVAADVLVVHITWTGTVPTATASTGTVLSTTLVGDGVYRIVVASASITAANANEAAIFPAYNAAAAVALTGTIYAGDFLAWNAATDQLAYDSGCVLAIPSGLDAEERAGLNVWRDFIASTAYSARYVRVNVNDTANPDGYIDVYRFGVFGAFQPEVNVADGSELRFTDATRAEDTDGGATIFDRRRTRREFVGALDMMSESEAYGDWFAIKQRVGRAGQVYFCMDPADADSLRWKRAFLGTIADVDAIAHPSFALHNGRLHVREEL